MTKRVFFSFNYVDVESFRANVVRNHDLTKETGTSGFFDASIWEDAELHGSEAIKRLINSSLENTSVTCVLIGTDTWQRRWVRYEILKSYDRGNSLLGVHINNIPDKNRQVYSRGLNPFDYLGFYIDENGQVDHYQQKDNGRWTTFNDLTPTIGNFDSQWRNKGYRLSDWVKCYDWINDNGFDNFKSWVNEAI